MEIAPCKRWKNPHIILNNEYNFSLEMSALSIADSGKCDVISLNNTLEKGMQVYALVNICAILPVMFFPFLSFVFYIPQ